jgi:hypothetical protein
MGNWSSQFYVPHALPPDPGSSYLNAALVADNPFEADPLILATVTFEVLGGAKDSFTEKAVLLRF